VAQAGAARSLLKEALRILFGDGEPDMNVGPNTAAREGL
jgi:hypothetical protein